MQLIIFNCTVKVNNRKFDSEFKTAMAAMFVVSAMDFTSTYVYKSPKK